MFRRCNIKTLTAVALVAAAGSSYAQYTPVFYDGFAVSADSFNINLDVASRQSGALASIPYVAVPGPADDLSWFQHQVFSVGSSENQPLLIAENGSNPPGAGPIFSYQTMVSPDFNFNSQIAEGVVGKRITFTLDVGVDAVDAGFGTFTKAGIVIGGQSTLINAEDEVAIQEGLPPSEYFGMQFVEDGLTAETNSFMQAFSNGFIIEDEGNSGVVVPHNGGTAPLAIQLDIDDPSDGNPWDGVGSTVIEVFVNGESIYTYEKTGGGYTNNYITLFGSRQFAANQLATHTFDDLTVFAAPTETLALPGDYNEDGKVDAADYTVYRDNFNQSISLPGEDPAAATPGLVDAEDYAYWAANYGSSAPSTAIPEPAGLVLAAGSLLAGRRRWRL